MRSERNIDRGDVVMSNFSNRGTARLSAAFVPGVLVVAALGLAMQGAVAGSPKRSEFPSAENIGPPFYARVEFDGVVHTDIVPNDGEWAAVVFYRGPDCIPEDFNLRQFFDFPVGDPETGDLVYPGFLVCAGQLNIRGFEVWKTAPYQDFAPMQIRFSANPEVPVWFVKWNEFEPVARNALTMRDLQDENLMPSLRKGWATSYSETLHPTDGAVNPGMVIVASGILEDGGSFRLKHVGNVGGRKTTISFGD
jgi:hypothetical protein